MRMTLQYIQSKKTKSLLLINQKYHHCHFSHGSITILWKLTVTIAIFFQVLLNHLQHGLMALPLTDLKLDDHVNNFYKEACQKLNALTLLLSWTLPFIESQLGYSPLVWMLYSWNLNNKINGIHEQSMRITYNSKSSSSPKLLEKDKSVTIQHRNIASIQILARAFFISYE